MTAWLRAVLLVLFFSLTAARAQAAIERFAVLIGSNRGEASDAELRYAEADAESMQAVLKRVGGFRPENMLLLRGESAPTITRALIAMNDRVRAALGRPGTQVVLFVYYSGHGDALALKTAGSRLELTTLEQLVRSSAAAFRILLVDACRSGALTRVKGGRRVPAIDVRVDQSLDGEGTVFLTSSSANEDAQESDAIQGSFFTHFFRSGLLGPADADGNGRVTLDEAYRHARDATLRATSRTLAGLQHATFRYELKGQGGLVLSTPGEYAATRSWLEFPAGRDYLVLAGGEHGSVVGEVGAYDRVRQLSVEPGQYFVRGRTPEYLLEGSVSVGPGATVVVHDARLTRADYARLARKGGSELRFVHGPFAGYWTLSPLANTRDWCHGAFAGYALVYPSLTLAPRLGACRSGFENTHLSAVVDIIEADLRASYTLDLPVVSLNIGTYAGPTLYSQRFDNAGPAPARTSFGAHFGIGAGLELDLGRGFVVFGEGNAEAHAFVLESTQTSERDLRASLAFSPRAGLLKLW